MCKDGATEMNSMYPESESVPADNAAHYSHDEKSPMAAFLDELARAQDAQERRHRKLMLLVYAWIIFALILTGVWAFLI